MVQYNMIVIKRATLLQIAAVLMLHQVKSWLIQKPVPTDSTEDRCPAEKDFDYIIVGTGSTGSVIINRLSEDKTVKVLALEAGGPPSHITNVPMLAWDEMHTDMDWNYTTVPQETCCEIYDDNVIQYTRGKSLGGTAAVNFMAYTTANKRDYDTWDHLGNDGWGASEMECYFKNIEDYKVPLLSEADAPYHNIGGPQPVEVPQFKSKLADAFLKAGQELGYPLVDYNAATQIGFMFPPVTIHNGSRWSAYRAFLEPAMERDNLKVITFAHVTRILFDENKTATGVEFRQGSSTCTAFAAREVIVSAGAINSPQLLMLSGVGPKEILDKFEIPIVHVLPGVGQSLQDHAVVGGQVFILNDTVSLNAKRYQTPEYMEQWEKNRTGPLTVPASFEGVGFLNTGVNKDDPPDWPDIELYFSSDNTARHLTPYLKPLLRPLVPGPTPDAMSCHPFLLRPKSRGTITLQSADPLVQPLIDPKYLSDPNDAAVLGAGAQLCSKLAMTDAFQKYDATIINMNLQYPTCLFSHIFGEEEFYKCVAQKLTTVGYHPSSSCKMGPSNDTMAVVDNELRVYGVRNLRVADASIMPNIVAGHPQAACMVIGEKLADLVMKKKCNLV